MKSYEWTRSTFFNKANIFFFIKLVFVFDKQNNNRTFSSRQSTWGTVNSSSASSYPLSPAVDCIHCKNTQMNIYEIIFGWRLIVRVKNLTKYSTKQWGPSSRVTMHWKHSSPLLSMRTDTLWDTARARIVCLRCSNRYLKLSKISNWHWTQSWGDNTSYWYMKKEILP